MSNTQYAFLMRSKVPDRAALQASIDALGFDLKLDPEYTPFTDSGYSPCALFGVPNAGFEIAYESAEDLKELSDISGDNDFCIRMTWGGGMRDCACAVIVGYALARDFDAVVSYEGGPPDSLEQLLAATHEIINRAQTPEPQPKSRSPSMKAWWRFW